MNFFGWAKIPSSKTDEDPIPVYGTPIDYSRPKALINIAFNPDILLKYGKHAKNLEERDLLIKLAFQYTEKENQVELDQDDYDIIEESICFGDEQEQISKLSKNSSQNKMSDLELAQEAMEQLNGKQLPDSILNKISGINKPKETSHNKDKNSSKVLIEEIKDLPKYEETYEKCIENNENKMYYNIKINLPNVESMNECELDVDEDFISLSTSLYRQLKIPLFLLRQKYEFQENDITAKFVKNNQILKIKIYLKNKL